MTATAIARSSGAQQTRSRYRIYAVALAAFGLVAAMLVALAPPAAAVVSEDIAPLRTIAGANTQLDVGANASQGPGAMTSFDDGTIAVGDGFGNFRFFAPGADGDVAPQKSVEPENPVRALGLATLPDGSFAATATAGGTVGLFSVFDADASGASIPIQQVVGANTGLRSALGIAYLSSGEIAVADAARGTVQIFAEDATGDVAPLRSIEGRNTGLDFPYGVAELADGSIAVANVQGQSISVFAEDASGDVAPQRVISGGSTELASPAGIAALSDGRLLVANSAVAGGESSLTVYEGDASGDVAPVHRIAGSATGLSNPTGVAELPDGTLAAVNPTAGSVTVYALGDPAPPRAPFVPVEPFRVYDSRTGDGPLAGGTSRTIDVEVPEAAVAVAYNLTATGMTGPGLLSVAPGGATDGGTSVLNYSAAGQTFANAYISGLGPDGTISVTATGASTQFIVDVVGFFGEEPPPPTAAAGGEVQAANGGFETFPSLFVPIVPQRTYDSRDIGTGGPLAGSQSRVVNVTAGGVVPSTATAVAYTLTQTGTVGAGYLAVGPAGESQPAVSSINWFQSNQVSANSSIVAINNGAVEVWAGTSPGGSTQFVIDILGYYLPEPEAPWAGAFTPIDPQRAYDSRVDEPAGPISGGKGFTTSMAVEGVPEDAVAVAFNLTATKTVGSGFLTTMPGDVLSPPVASTLNWWRSNQTLANGSVVDVPNFDRIVKAKGEGVNGTLALPVTTFAGGGSTQYIIDVAGYYTFALRN